MFSKAQPILLMPILAFIMLFAVLPDTVKARDNKLIFDHLSSSDGLSGGGVLSIFQDSKGYMWFGTYDGLNKFDGYEITLFTANESDTTSISNSYVNAIAEDHFGRLWIGTNSGLNVYDRNTNVFKRIKLSNDTIQEVIESLDYILALHVENEKLWAGTHGGLVRINISKNKINVGKIFFKKTERTIISYVSSFNQILRDHENKLWFTNYTDNLFLFDPEKDTLETFPISVNHISTEQYRASKSIFVDRQNNFWINYQHNPLIFWDRRHNRFIPGGPFPLLNKNLSGLKPSSFYFPSDSVIWIATDGDGLFIYNSSNNNISHQTYHFSDPKGLASNKLTGIYKDNQDLVWIGTVKNGVNIYNPVKSRFNHIYPYTAQKLSLKINNIISFTEDEEGNIWIGTDGDGMVIYNTKTGTFSEKDLLANEFQHETVTFLYFDSKGFLWISSYPNGLYIYNRNTNRLSEIFYSGGDGDNEHIIDAWNICEDRDGRIWIGTLWNGLLFVDRNTGMVYRLLSDVNNPFSIPHQGIMDVYIDRSNTLWVGTYHGLGAADLNRLRFEDGIPVLRFKNYYYDPDKNSISSNRIFSINELPDGKILLGTETAGLNILNVETGEFKLIDQNSGLAGNKVHDIEVDNQAGIWAGTNQGLSRIYYPDSGIINYYVTDGLHANENLVIYKYSDNRLLVGGNNGFNIFQPESIRVDSSQIQVYITSFQIFNDEIIPGRKTDGRIILQNPPGSGERAILKYNQNSLTFEFVTIDLINPSKIEYAYQLEGFDKKWIFCGHKRNASYTNLSPGEYIFKVKSTNSEGIWGQMETHFSFSIRPPWWKTKAAFFSYLVLLLALLIFARYLTIKEMKIRHELKMEQLSREKEKEISQLKLAFFTNISHELRTPLTLIYGPINNLYHIAKEKDWGKEIIQQFRLITRNISRMLELTNQLLDLRKLETGKMKLTLQRGNLPDFITEISENFKTLAERKNIGLDFKNELPASMEIQFDADKINKILSNLLSNAIKFTPENGKIIFKVAYINGNLEIEVRDSGIGIEKEHLPHIFDRFFQIQDNSGKKIPGTGIGLSLTQDLVIFMNGIINVDSIPGIGTSFTVSLPLEKTASSVTGQTSEIKVEHPAPPLDSEIDFPDEDEEELTDDPSTLKESILIAEDNKDMRRYIARILAKNYSILEAENGKHALEIALEAIPTLIISDVMMPDMNGIELGKKIKTDIRTSHIPVIFLTALSSTENELEGLETGAEDYITKPFDEEILKVKIKNLVDNREKIRSYLNRQMGITSSFIAKDEYNSEDISISSLDQKFIEKLEKIVSKNLDSPDFNVKKLSREIGMGSTQLFMKFKALLNISPGSFIFQKRLSKAALLLRKSDLNINEVGYAVGFTDPKYFSKCFKKHFGKTPSEFKNQT